MDLKWNSINNLSEEKIGRCPRHSKVNGFPGYNLRWQFNIIFNPNIKIKLRKFIKYKVTISLYRREVDVECNSSLIKSLLIDSLNIMKIGSEWRHYNLM